ncbi:hypothetical protein TNIN_282581 [Trichonephila inaurata madagascariensis]|uniref:Uncharacterized protein n=1 Tax=Trichonephila inaurata madagascariensis TaxID=2747483 RepID=A0A8X7C8P8_9ARAC|nr:hypothetical protein TNIN_282581 [Trichonephila inaurata madagascariensis]
MPSRLKLHSVENSTCVVKSGCTANRWRNHPEKIYTWLMVGCFQGVHTLRMLRSNALSPNTRQTLCSSHFRWWIQSTCSSPIAPRIHTTHAFKFRSPRTPTPH